MTLPGGLATVQVTGEFLDASGQPLTGRVTFVPTADLTDPGNSVVIPAITRAYTLSRGRFTSDPLVATDNGSITPTGWAYTVTVSLADLDPISYEILLPQATTPVDLSALTPVAAQPAVSAYLTLAGGTVTGPLTLAGGLQIPAGALGDVLTSDAEGNAGWEPLSVELPSATSSVQGVVQLTSDLGGSAGAPHVLATHLTSPLPINQGGTNAASGTAALTGLGGDSRYGQLASTNAWTGASTFKGPKPWFDLDAYGADPSGVSDSTVAFNQCAAAVLGGVYYTNLGMTASSTTVTNPAAVSGDLNLFVNHPNFSAGYAQITAVTPGVGYTMSAAATANLSGQSAFVGYAQSQTIGTPLGRMRMGAGTYKVTSDLVIRSAAGFFLEGQGPGATTLQASGAGFTQAVLFLDGHSSGVFRNFGVSGDTTEGTATSGSGGGVPDGVRLDYTTASRRSTTGVQFDNILVRNLIFVTGFSLEGTPSRQLDGTVCRNVIVTGQQTAGSWSSSGNWQAGIAIGNGTAGNVLDQVLYACGTNRCYYGYYNNNSSFGLFGGQPSSNGTDFYMVANGQCTIESVQSQSGGQFLVSPSAAASQPVSFRDCRFSGWTGTGYNAAWVSIGSSRTNWTFDNVRYAAGSPPTPPVMNLGSGNNGASYSLSNIVVPAPPSTGIVPPSGVPVVVVNYVDTTSGRTVYPFYAVNAGVLFQQGLAASKPSASTYGELLYYATDTGLLFHSSGSAWTQITTGAGSVTADPLSIGRNQTYALSTTVSALGTSSTVLYAARLFAAGYTTSTLNCNVQTADSGNTLSVAVLDNTGTKGPGTLLAYGTATPSATGDLAITLNTAVTPLTGYYVAWYCPSSTLKLEGQDFGLSNSGMNKTISASGTVGTWPGISAITGSSFNGNTFSVNTGVYWWSS